MAIIVNSKRVKDLQENSHVAIGVTLPFTRGSNGFFAQSYQTIDQIKSNLRNLLTTRKGERLMQPNFGTDLYTLLFSQNTDELEPKIESAIDSAISYWMPYVSINQIDLQQSNANKDMYMFVVSIKFQVAGQQTLETVTFNILE